MPSGSVTYLKATWARSSIDPAKEDVYALCYGDRKLPFLGTLPAVEDLLDRFAVAVLLRGV